MISVTSAAYCPTQTGTIVCAGGTGGHNLYENIYVHGWTTFDSLNSTTHQPQLGNAAFANAYNAVGSVYDHVEVDGSDAGGPFPFLSCFAMDGEFKNSKCHDTAGGSGNFQLIHDTEFYNINGIPLQQNTNGHSNLAQALAARAAFYNNIAHDITVGQAVGMCSNGAAIYNNVMWNVSGGGGGALLIDGGACGSGTSGTNYILNNTVRCASGEMSCYRLAARGVGIGTVYLYNNHWITDGSPAYDSTAPTNQGTNVTMPTATAASQGYSISNKFAPTSNSNSTVNAGTSLSSLCSGSLSALCSDVKGAPWYGGSYNPRPSGGTAWDVGAYEY